MVMNPNALHDTSKRAAADPGLVVLDGPGALQPEAWLQQLRAMVEQALRRHEERIVERERVIAEQSSRLNELEQEVRHKDELIEAKERLSTETGRRLHAAARNLRLAVEERDRRLVVFARKLAQVRQTGDDLAARRRHLLDELKRVKWYQRARRAELLAQLEQLA